MKIDIIGSYPPPYGGMSIHVQRLSEHLGKIGINHTIYNTTALRNAQALPRKGKHIVAITSPLKWLLKYFFQNDADIVYLCVGSSWKLRLYFGLIIGLIRRKRVVIVIGGNDLSWPYAISCLRDSDASFSGKLVTRLVIFSLKQASFIVCVNPDISSLMLSLGIEPSRIETIPGFIPPIVKEEDMTEIPKEVWSFIGNHSPIISANAFMIRFYQNQDLYGIDMCIELCASLKSAYPQIGFVFNLPDIGDYDYFNELKRRITEKGIEDNFLFQTKPSQFYPILMKSDIFTRPTASDGDAVSLREALYLKIPSVASDVVPRPEGTVLFKNRDVADFIDRVKMVWDDYSYYKLEMESLEVENGLSKILEIYRSLASKSKISPNFSSV